MAKKKSSKKHSFKHVAPVRTQAVEEGTPERTKAEPQTVLNTGTGSLPAGHTTQQDQAYMKDIKVILGLTLLLIGVQAGLWYLLNNTQLGPALYDLIKL